MKSFATRSGCAWRVVRHLAFGCASILALQLAPASAAVSPQIESEFDFSTDTTPEARKFYFKTVLGRRYTLWRSTDLQNWNPVPGYPKVATDLFMEHAFAQGEKEFFRIEPIDEKAPEVSDQFPGADSYAVRRFDDLRFVLNDATGIDPASIRLTLGSGTALSVGAAGLSFVDNVLTYDSGDAALGDYGSTLQVTLTMADTLGHSTTHVFSFTLEVLPKVQSSLYVFGSPAAQRAGQRIPATPTAALAKQAGPVRMDDADPWEIETILPDRIVIAYTGASAPAFAVDMYLVNLTPVKLTDILYRKTLSVNDSPATKKLTLMTVDVPFAEIVEEGTAALSADSVIYDLDDGGTIQSALQFSYNMTFPKVGFNLDGVGPLALSGNPKFSVSLPEANVWFTPKLEVAFETKYFSVQRASIQSRTDIKAALVANLTYTPWGVETEKEWELHKPITKLAFVGAVGPVPVWVDFTYSTKLKFKAEANVPVSLQAGWRRNISMNAGASYIRDSSPRITWTGNSTAGPLEYVPLTLSGGGTASAKVRLIPQVDVRLLSLIGFYVNSDPRAEAEITATGSLTFFPEDSSAMVEAGGSAFLRGGVFADLNAGLSIRGVDQSYLPMMEPYRLFTRTWTYPDDTVLIPAGRFQMGDSLGDSDLFWGPPYNPEKPVHTVQVSEFYMGKYEVTKELWDQVRTWGLDNDYTDLAVGNGSYASKGAHHPVHSITWYDMVKWCNARSEMEGLTPCYTVSGSTYKTGHNDAVVCNWSANGYRLPTEAEWEKAARGGLSGKRYPLGDTISHAQANYYAFNWEGSPTYGNLSGNAGHHPIWSNNDDGNYPYSSPVGTFAANGYGLYDMAGNMWEWCWDWRSDSYPSTLQTDPHGATSGSLRALRGGGMYSDGSGAGDCRTALRYYDSPTFSYDGLGFRIARSSVP